MSETAESESDIVSELEADGLVRLCLVPLLARLVLGWTDATVIRLRLEVAVDRVEQFRV